MYCTHNAESKHYITETAAHGNATYRWTLGGVYLARYDDSPVGSFDEVSHMWQLMILLMPS